MMDDLNKLATKKNISSLLILAILILAIPLGVRLIKQQQILRSKAATASATFVQPNIETRLGPNGIVTVATQSAVGLELVSPEGWLVSPPPPPPPTATTLQLTRYHISGGDFWTTTTKLNPTAPSGYLEPSGDGKNQGYIYESNDSSGLLQALYDCTDTYDSGSKIDHFNRNDTSTNCSDKPPVLLGYLYINPPSGKSTSRLFKCTSDTTSERRTVKAPKTCADGFTDKATLGYVLDSP